MDSPSETGRAIAEYTKECGSTSDCKSELMSMAGRRTDGSGVVTGTSLTHTKAGNASALSLVAATSSVSESESETLA